MTGTCMQLASLFEEERQHWITTAYINGEVQLYDSCFTGKIYPSIEKQMVQLYKQAMSATGLVVCAMPFQQQI